MGPIIEHDLYDGQYTVCLSRWSRTRFQIGEENSALDRRRMVPWLRNPACLDNRDVQEGRQKRSDGLHCSEVDTFSKGLVRLTVFRLMAA